MNALLLDLLFIVVALSLSSLSVIVAYKLGEYVWKEKFDIQHVDADGVESTIPGQIGEVAAALLIGALVMLVNLLTPDVSISNLVTEYKTFLLALLLVIVLTVLIYTISAVRKDEIVQRGDNYRNLLLKGYRPYSLYSILNYCGLSLIAGLILQQLSINYEAYIVQQDTVDRLVAAAMLDLERRPGAFDYHLEPGTVTTSLMKGVAEAVLARIETIHGETVVSASRIVDQVNTLLLFVLVTFVTNFAITYTPMSQVFEKSAIRIAHITLYASIAGILLLSWVLFLTIYSGLFNGVLGVVNAASPILSGGHWEAINRFNEIRIDLTDRQGLTGFFLSLTSGRGGVLLALGAVQWLISRQSEASKTNKPSRN